MNKSIRQSTFAVLLGAAALAASAGSANAAFTWSVAADNSARDTIFIFPSLQEVNTNPGPLYTAGGSPVVTNNAGVITFNFNAGLSANFGSSADGSVIVEQSTDGHLVLDVHFDTPTSISAVINEGGVYTTDGNGSVNVTGGEVVIEAVDPAPVETHSSALSATFDGQGGWSASATTIPFSGLFTDYQIAIDNDLIASATDGDASIFKKTFTLQLIPGGGTPPTPEPASLSLLGIGAAGMLLRRRRA